MASETLLRLTDRAGGFLGELRTATLEDTTWDLNGSGGATVSVNPLRPEASRIALNKTEIQIWIDGEYRHCVIPRGARGNSKSVKYQCEGLFSYFEYRHINDSLQYGNPDAIPPTYVDQFQIGWNLVNLAQTGTNRTFRVASSPWTPCGVGRMRRWNWYEHKQILNELMSLTEVDRGFDMEIVLFPDGRREWTPYYPRKGSLKSKLVLEWGRNVVDFDFAEDGQNQATKTYATGGTAGDTRFEQNYEDIALSGEYGVMEKIVSDGTELDVEFLADRAKEEVTANGRPVVLPDLFVKDIEGVKLDGVLETGDIVPVKVNHGACTMIGNYRVVRIVRTRPGRLKLSFNVWSG